jgi:hypothetical protein
MKCVKVGLRFDILYLHRAVVYKQVAYKKIVYCLLYYR